MCGEIGVAKHINDAMLGVETEQAREFLENGRFFPLIREWRMRGDRRVI
jgi:hypothetical protein